jgi:competence protein ComEC
LGFICGFAWCLLYAHWVASWSLPAAIENKNIIITGYIASLPAERDHYIRFEFVTHKAKMELNWSNNYPQLTIGDKWQLEVRLKRPHGSMNPGGFDYEKYLFANRIRAVGYVVPRSSLSANQQLTSLWYKYPVGRFRQSLQKKIAQALPNKPLAGVVTALTIGQRSGIIESQWQVFNNTGTTHLVAISGLHIGLISGSVFFIINFIWRRISWLTLRIPAQRAAAAAAILTALFYAAMAGFAIPTQRALLMVIAFMGLALVKRNTAPWHAWFIALFMILLLDPLASMVGGFWLSFASVGSLIYAFSGRLKVEGWWWRWGRAQVVVAIGLLPFCLLIFQQFSLTSLFGNVVAIPWVGFIVVPLCLIGSILTLVSPLLGGLLLVLAEKALELVWVYLNFLASQHWAIWHYTFLNNWQLWASIVGIALILAPKGLPGRWLGIIWLLPIWFYQPAKPQNGEIWFTLLDVGQGLATVIQTQNHVLVYDTGPKYSEAFDSGKMMVVPYLQKNAIRTIDALVVSHGDNDHIGGADAVLKLVTVKKIFTSVPEHFPGQNAVHCWREQKWVWDGVNFEFIAPPANKFMNSAISVSKNNESCVLKVGAILLTGDIEKPEEKELLQNYGADLASAILVVPHHGSNSSSTEPFVTAVNPKYALFSDGYLNRFRFPSKKVLARYEEINTIYFNTIGSGAIIIHLRGEQVLVKPVEYRKQASYFWNW